MAAHAHAVPVGDSHFDRLIDSRFGIHDDLLHVGIVHRFGVADDRHGRVIQDSVSVEQKE